MYKGRYVALVEYDFTFNESAPNARPIEEIRKMFRNGNVEKELTQLLCDEAFAPRMGNCEVTQQYFTLYELPKEEDKPTRGCATCKLDGMDLPQCRECDAGNRFARYVQKKED